MLVPLGLEFNPTHLRNGREDAQEYAGDEAAHVDEDDAVGEGDEGPGDEAGQRHQHQRHPRPDGVHEEAPGQRPHDGRDGRQRRYGRHTSGLLTATLTPYTDHTMLTTLTTPCWRH